MAPKKTHIPKDPSLEKTGLEQVWVSWFKKHALLNDCYFQNCIFNVCFSVNTIFKCINLGMQLFGICVYDWKCINDQNARLFVKHY